MGTTSTTGVTRVLVRKERGPAQELLPWY